MKERFEDISKIADCISLEVGLHTGDVYVAMEACFVAALGLAKQAKIPDTEVFLGLASMIKDCRG